MRGATTAGPRSEVPGGAAMRQWRVVIVTVLGCVLAAGTVAVASDEVEASDPPDRREEVVALVLDQDERFAGVPDYERQWIKSKAEFSFDPIIGSGYYRVLPTSTTRWREAVGMDLFAFRQPRNWLVEVVLVRDCAPHPRDVEVEVPWPDPCAWRRSWFYRVTSDDAVTLLFEEGDPDPMAGG